MDFVEGFLNTEVIFFNIFSIIIFIGLIVLSRIFISKDFQKIKRWKFLFLFMMFFFMIIQLIYARKTISNFNPFLFFPMLIFGIIIILFIFFYIFSAIEGIWIILRNKDYNKRKKDFWICIIVLLMINPFSLQLIQSLNSTMSQYVAYQGKMPCGVLVGEIVFDSPAYKEGLSSGEIIKKFNNQDIETADKFIEKISEVVPEETIYIETDKSVYIIVLGRTSDRNNGFLGVSGIKTVYCNKDS